METKNLDALATVLFNVEKVEMSKFGIRTNSKDEFGIVGYPSEGGKILLNTCSQKYNIVKNEDVLLPLMDLVENEMGNVKLRVINEEDARFNVSIIPVKPLNGKAIVGEILPRFNFSNSYDGSVNAFVEGGLFRTVCENGAAAPIHGKTFKYNFKHNDRALLDKKTWEEVTAMMQIFLTEFDTIETSINQMKKKKIAIATLSETLEALTVGTLFPKKALATALDRANIESVSLGENMNAWLAYNGLNYVLNHDREYKIVQHVRNSIDAKLFDNALEFSK